MKTVKRACSWLGNFLGLQLSIVLFVVLALRTTYGIASCVYPDLDAQLVNALPCLAGILPVEDTARDNELVITLRVPLPAPERPS